MPRIYRAGSGSAAAVIDPGVDRVQPDAAMEARIPRLSDDAPARLSFNQERELYRDLWAKVHGFRPVSLNITVRFAFDTPVDRGALQRALDEIVRRHEV